MPTLPRGGKTGLVSLELMSLMGPIPMQAKNHDRRRNQVETNRWFDPRSRIRILFRLHALLLESHQPCAMGEST
ncbi:hypothetical protein C8Q70DRAFT_742054 [Cubamyces menziesii]|nr:hypothetical protein C8Q70DRAFT_742054 [Cubamyces menziesii]